MLCVCQAWNCSLFLHKTFIRRFTQIKNRLLANQDPHTFAIIGAAMEVHRVLGPGFLEGVYQEALAIEFNERSIPFQREYGLEVSYKGQTLGCKYRADFICLETIIVAIKALAQLASTDQAQVLHYMKATQLEKALLLNFGPPSLQHRRLILSATNTSQYIS